PGWGYWIAGAAAVAALVALVTGVVVHRKLFADFFTLRLRRSAQRGWLDLHNVGAVVGLPFCLMICYTGLVTLMHQYMPWGMKAAYGSEEREYYREVFDWPASPGERAAPESVSLEQLFARPGEVFGGAL